MRARRRPLTVVPVTSHSPERDAELLSRLDDDGADARDRRIMVGPTFDELTAERKTRPFECGLSADEMFATETTECRS